MKHKSIIILAVFVAVAAAASYYYVFVVRRPAAETYNPVISPIDFSTAITNKYFSLSIGKKFVYEGQTADGLERVEISITGYTKEIMGVQTLVYRDKVYLNGQLIEDTRDYLAQDREGNVWYFGEDVDNYENGTLKDHAGSWIAGVDGAKPGIWMKANPKVGDIYRQEYYQGEAEDMAEVLSVSETVTTKRVTYQNCLQTLDTTPLEPNLKEHKYYCPDAAGLVFEVNLTDGDRVELVEITTDPSYQRREATVSDCGAYQNFGVRFTCAGKWKVVTGENFEHYTTLYIYDKEKIHMIEGGEAFIISVDIQNDTYDGSIQKFVEVQNASLPRYDLSSQATTIGGKAAYRLRCSPGQMYCTDMEVVFANRKVYQFLNRANELAEEGTREKAALDKQYIDLITSVAFYET